MLSIEYLRSFRLGGYAIFDFAISFIGMAIIAPLLTKGVRKLGIEIPFCSWMLLVIPIAVLSHLLAGTDTRLTRQVLDPNGFYLQKAIVLICLIIALIKIKRI